MVQPLRTPTIVFDVAFTSQVDQAVQYREAIFAAKTAFLAAGWAVERCSDSVSAASSDLWLTAANIVNAAAGSAHSWIVMVSPIGWLPNSGQIRVTLDCIAPTPDTTPQLWQVYFQNASHGATGTNTDRPPAVGTETAILTVGQDIIPWPTAVAGRYTTWTTARGDVMMIIKPQGVMEARFAFILTANTDTDGGGEGDNRFYFFAHDSNTAGILTAANLGNTSACRGLSPGGSNADASAAESSIWNVTLWSGGISGGGQTVAVPIDLYANVAVRGRPLGSVIDIYAVPTTLPAGTLDDAETGQTYRRICMDNVMIYVPTASLPFA